MGVLSLIKLPFKYARYLRRKSIFGAIGFHTSIGKALRITCPQSIYLGDNVSIAPYAWLAAEPHNTEGYARLVIKDGCTIGDFSHIYATNEVIIEENVLTANFVYISDTNHEYSDINLPILKQPIRKSKVRIGEGSWLGEHVSVCGASIGKHCIIGANSVVTKDIPDYCVAVGSPAKIIKRYSFDENKWKKIDSEKDYATYMGGVVSTINYWQHKVSFRKCHKSDIIKNPIILTPQHIELGENVYIGFHARIEGVENYNDRKFTPLIIIEDGVSIQQNLHMTCANKIVIGANTAIAANVTITDIHHSYTDINTPIEKQDIIVKEVVIGEDCKIYNNVVILPGVHIGKHVTVGANSIVTSDLPDYSVAVGMPAKIIKKYDFENKDWIKV